jgi:nucleotide-binding universal stress UspA family protein
MSAIRIILHPTDFSDHSRHAFQVACSSARDHNARLVLLHVLPAPTFPLVAGKAHSPPGTTEAEASLKKRFAWPQPPDPDVQVEHRVAEGDAPEEIVRLAHALRCDLIVMGTHGRTGLGRLLNGSVAEEVLRQAPCPVLAVKTPPHRVPPTDAPAPAGALVDVRPLGAALASARTTTLARADGLEILRLVVRAGAAIQEGQGDGPVSVQCLEGQVAVTALGRTQALAAGELLCLPGEEPYTIQGMEDASLLVTTLRPPP